MTGELLLLQGRYIMWGWLQERRKVGSYDYAGCLSLPRVLYIRGDRLIQARKTLNPECRHAPTRLRSAARRSPARAYCCASSQRGRVLTCSVLTPHVCCFGR